MMKSKFYDHVLLKDVGEKYNVALFIVLFLETIS